MKKLKPILLFSLFTLASCAKTPVDFTVTSFDNVMSFGDKFDTSKVDMTVTFDDGSKSKADAKDIKYSFAQGDSMFNLESKVTLSYKDSSVKKEIDFTLKPRTSLSLLFIGNSFSDDTIWYMNEICSSLGITASLVNVYRGASSVDQNYEAYVGNYSMYEARRWVNNAWTSTNYESIKPNVTSYDWDFVSIQQVSGESGLSNKYSQVNSYADAVISDFVNKDHTQLIWNMTWAYDETSGHSSFVDYGNNQMTMYNGIVNTVKDKIRFNDRFATVIPNATSIQNARTTSYKSSLCRDGYHLSVYGRYIAGLTAVKALTGVSIDDIEYAPEGVTTAMKLAAIESVKNAIYTPYSVTNTANYLINNY